MMTGPSTKCIAIVIIRLVLLTIALLIIYSLAMQNVTTQSVSFKNIVLGTLSSFVVVRINDNFFPHNEFIQFAIGILVPFALFAILIRDQTWLVYSSAYAIVNSIVNALEDLARGCNG
jgi:multisubunit Na+/H+ antiporter MnhE subunit